MTVYQGNFFKHPITFLAIVASSVAFYVIIADYHHPVYLAGSVSAGLILLWYILSGYFSYTFKVQGKTLTITNKLWFWKNFRFTNTDIQSIELDDSTTGFKQIHILTENRSYTFGCDFFSDTMFVKFFDNLQQEQFKVNIKI